MLLNKQENIYESIDYFPFNHTYADALLRTFASLKPPSPSTLSITSPEHNHVDSSVSLVSTYNSYVLFIYL